MTIPKDHEARVLQALKEHDTDFLMKYIASRLDRRGVIEFAVQETVALIEGTTGEDSLRVADTMLMALVHAQVTPSEAVREAYRQGVKAGSSGGTDA